MTLYIMILLEEVESDKSFELYSKFNSEDYPTQEHKERYVQECIEDYNFGGCNDLDEVYPEATETWKYITKKEYEQAVDNDEYIIS